MFELIFGAQYNTTYDHTYIIYTLRDYEENDTIIHY